MCYYYIFYTLQIIHIDVNRDLFNNPIDVFNIQSFHMQMRIVKIGLVPVA